MHLLLLVVVHAFALTCCGETRWEGCGSPRKLRDDKCLRKSHLEIAATSFPVAAAEVLAHGACNAKRVRHRIVSEAGQGEGC